jgi:hypothetical protein
MVKIVKWSLIPVALLNVSMVESVWSLWSQSTLFCKLNYFPTTAVAYAVYRLTLLESRTQDYHFYVNVQTD